MTRGRLPGCASRLFFAAGLCGAEVRRAVRWGQAQRQHRMAPQHIAAKVRAEAVVEDMTPVQQVLQVDVQSPACLSCLLDW